MHYQEFIQEIKRRSDIADDKLIQRVVEVSLSTFGQRLSAAMAGELGAQLPKELKINLQSSLGYRRQESFSLEQFYNRVKARADIGYPEAVRLSRIVMETVRDAVSRGLLAKVLRTIPAEYGELFGQEPTTPLSPTTE